MAFTPGRVLHAALLDPDHPETAARIPVAEKPEPMIHVIKHVLLPCPGFSKRAKLPDSAPLTTKATLRHAPSHFRKNDFNRSMVCRHFGAVGWQTVFWLPNSPNSSNKIGRESCRERGGQ